MSSWIPASGGLGVIANATDAAQKDINGEITAFVKNRIPGLKSQLPNQIDIWTGDPINDIDNPFLRALNAISPIQVNGSNEPWREFLQDIQYRGLGILKFDSTGSYEWKPEDREIINKYIGEQKLYKEIERIMKRKDYQKQIKALKALRNQNNQTNKDKIELKTTLLPIHQDLNQVIREALKIAEARYLREHPHVQQSIYNAQQAKNRMKEGNVEGAGNIQKKDLETKQLIEYGN